MTDSTFPPSMLRFTFGTPIETGAVRLKPNASEMIDGLHLDNFRCVGERYSFTLPLTEGEAVFGLGQQLGPLNRRGKRFRLFARDDGLHTPDKPGIYGSHPFLYLDKSSLAIMIDCPSEIDIDIGFTEYDQIRVEIHSTNFDLYIWKPDSLLASVQGLLSLIGKPMIPPRWSFGYQQCRYSYPDAQTVREVANNLRALKLPCDVIYIDIDYMKDYKVFTFDEGRFPDVPGLMKEMKEMGFKLIPIVDPGIRIESGFEPYETGLKNNVFCEGADGTPFIGAVWPGLTHFPDFMRKTTKDWWYHCHKEFIELGFSHYWNDMNEPAIFYTKERLVNVVEIAKSIPEDFDLRTAPIEFVDKLGGFFGAEDYYDEFYHQLENGEQVLHRTVHNLYGDRMALATTEALDRYFPGRRHFVLTRSSYLGTHRHAVMWTGDNHSWWEHMLTHMRMLQSMNMVGFFYCGADVGGFSGHASSELMVRWMQLGVFSPLFRNHSSKNTRGQEPWLFDDASLGMMRASLELRAALITYLYSSYLTAVDEAVPLISPLAQHYQDEQSKATDDQFMVGESLMACPVHQQNARHRFIYVPGNRPWLMWRPQRWNDFNAEVIQPGSHSVSVALGQGCALIKEDSLLPLNAPREHDQQPFSEELTVVGFVNSEATYAIQGDDGEHCSANRWNLRLRVTSSEAFASTENKECPFSLVTFEIFNIDGGKRRYTTKVEFKNS